MSKLKLILTAVLFFAFSAYSAETLDFSKKRNIYLGEGEFRSASFQIKNFETFDYQSEIRKPFVMKKVNSSGLVEFIFDSRTLSGDQFSDGKTYSATFSFTKKNIGKKENVTVSAVYKPELRIVVQDSLMADYAKLNFSPGKTSQTIKIMALRDVSGFKTDDPNSVLTLNGGKPVSFTKGLNDLVIELAKEENFEAEVLLFRTAGEGRINELYLVATSSGFKTTTVEAVVSNVTESELEDAADSLSADSAAAALYSDIQENTESENTAAPSSGFSMISIILISVMGLIILFLLFLIVTNKKSDMYNKYQTFFEDVASLVKINPKGSNIDKSIEEIMMILLEKFEYTPGQAEAPAAENKKVLKKPANLKSPGISPKKAPAGAPSDEIDLDFGSSQADKKISRSDIPLDPKPTSSGDKKISRGFDFLEDDN
jgi:hypothetical protein